MEIKIDLNKEELELILQMERLREEGKRNETDQFIQSLSDRFSQILTAISLAVQENKSPSNKE